MPRFGKDFKMYSRIVPSLQLDITDVMFNGEWADKPLSVQRENTYHKKNDKY